MTLLDSNGEITSYKCQLRGSTSEVRSMRTALLKVGNYMLGAIKEMYPASELHIYFLKKDGTQQLNRWFMSDGPGRMLEGKFLHFHIGVSERVILMTGH